MPRHTTEQFIEKARKVHGDLYDYTLVDYVNNSTRVSVKCHKHGPWSVIPNNHLNGTICKICAEDVRASKKIAKYSATFLDRIKLVAQHEGKGYTYDKFIYTRANDNIVVTCPVHSDFTLTAANHLAGAGCPKCTKCGYNKGKPGALYVLCTSDNMVKIGITNKCPLMRAKTISKSAGLLFECVCTYFFEDGEIPQKMEKELLKQLRVKHQQPVEAFDGATECFYGVNLVDILTDIKNLIQKHTDAYQPQQLLLSTNEGNTND